MLKAVRDAVAKVTDPEYPEVTIEQLGILERVFSSGESICIDLVPTRSGCPALEIIRTDVLAAAKDVGATSVSVKFCSDPVWTPDRITEDARRILAREFFVVIRNVDGSSKCPNDANVIAVVCTMASICLCLSLSALVSTTVRSRSYDANISSRCMSISISPRLQSTTMNV